MIKHQELHEETDLWRKLYTILRQFPHKEQVQFALFCAEEVNSELPVAKECVRLVKSWLKDSDSVTNEELIHAATAAYAYAAANVAAVAYAAYAAAYTASSAAYTAYTASSAAFAANAAAYYTCLLK